MEQKKLLTIAKKIASIAHSMETKVCYFLCTSTLAACFIAWHWLDFNHISFGFIAKSLLLFIPILFWLLLWLLLKQLTGLPEQVMELKSLAKNSMTTVADIKQGTASKKNIFSNLFKLAMTLREPEVLETILLCTKGTGLIINPLALLTLFIAAIFMIGFIVSAFLMIIF